MIAAMYARKPTDQNVSDYAARYPKLAKPGKKKAVV